MTCKSATRKAGPDCPDLHDEWQATDVRYLSENSMSQLYRERDRLAIAELTAGDQLPRLNPEFHHATGRPRL